MENQPIEKLEHEITIKLSEEQYTIAEELATMDGWANVQKYIQEVVLEGLRCEIRSRYNLNRNYDKFMKILGEKQEVASA